MSGHKRLLYGIAIPLAWLAGELVGGPAHDMAMPVSGAEAPCAYVAALNQPYVELPCAMAQEISAVVWCESRGDPDAVGKAGERGQLQLHPIHVPGMARAGLDFENERDRVVWAVTMWQRSDWRPWSCRP